MLTATILSLAVGYGQPIDIEQTSCIAEAVYHEARDQSLHGQALVAQVILNRADKRNLTPCEVVYQKKQFSFTLEPYSKRLERFSAATYNDARAKITSAQIALQAVTGAFKGIAFNSTHYYAYKKASPKWAKAFDNSLVVGDHRFLY